MGTSMLGEFSKVNRGRSRGAISRRAIVAGLQRRLRTRDEIPAWGQIVLRSTTSQILR
jgi:hypothetical protein